ncbi:hypothetical protein [Halobacillus sp. Cin3]|uniref:hypothetical protein n=1 Tax=Halobacillus sp. Cin3 TaxID=2928441 RepID=UPI00248E8281|nr:hypothetical protein [Halobacillus sp. Cin3]
MDLLNQRLQEVKKSPIHSEMIKGAHAGNVIRIETFNQNGEKEKLIYKEFAKDRNNEIDMYKKLGDQSRREPGRRIYHTTSGELSNDYRNL